MNQYYNKESNLFLFEYEGVEVYYEEGFEIKLVDENLISIIHVKDEFFRIIFPRDEIICDFVLTCAIEINDDKKNKVSCEIGVDERCSGFMSHLVSDDVYSVFCTCYSDDEIKEATCLLNK